MIDILLGLILASQIALAVDGYYREKRITSRINAAVGLGAGKILTAVQSGNQSSISEIFRTRNEMLAQLAMVHGEFKSEAAKLTAHTESLKAHGQALLDKAHTDEVVPRRVVHR